MNKLHLLYIRDKIPDCIVEEVDSESVQFCFPFVSQCQYNVPLPKGWKKYVVVLCYENSRTILRVNDLSELDIQKNHPAKKIICEYTGVLDINGRPLYTNDYVRTDEIGWCGFVFKDEPTKEEEEGEIGFYHGTIAVCGSGGFAGDPFAVEWYGNPVIDEWLTPITKGLCMRHERDFLRKEKIPFKDIY